MARAVLNQADISRALTRISHEILESNRGSSDLVLLGIPTRGVILARRIAETIARIEPDAAPALAGALDVTMYRGHREFPIRADFVGKNLPSSTRERINVRLAEIDGDDAVTIDGGDE